MQVKKTIIYCQRRKPKTDMLTDYDIQRLSSAIVKNLVNNDKFIKRMAKMMPKQKTMVSSSKAAKILGVTRKTICEIAEQLGGIKGVGKQARWMFDEDGLTEKYKEYKQRKS